MRAGDGEKWPRLTFNATLFETDTESYRLARSKAKKSGQAN
ncbi:hypothetical protein ACFRH4_30170 [Streptomyces mirabilis]